jgi:hypothetical protein
VFQPLKIHSLALDLSLISLNLLLLLLISIFLSLQLVSNQGTSTKPEGSTYSRSGGRMANSGADKSPSRGTSQRTDPCAFFPCT